MRLIGFYDYTVILTFLSLFSAIFGILNALEGAFFKAVLCVFFSGFCDAFDGMVARSKKNRTEDEKAFGIQLDSLCDLISFGLCPALICFKMGVDGILGTILVCLYTLCALIRLAFFNVLEEKRQKEEAGANKYYRGLPVTSIAIIFPIVYLFKNFLSVNQFEILLHLMLGIVAFLFVLDFKMKKLDLQKICHLH